MTAEYKKREEERGGGERKHHAIIYISGDEKCRKNVAVWGKKKLRPVRVRGLKLKGILFLGRGRFLSPSMSRKFALERGGEKSRKGERGLKAIAEE